MKLRLKRSRRKKFFIVDWLSKDYLGKLRGFADKLAVGPRIKRVNSRRERNGAKKDEKVTDCQVEDVKVWKITHRFVTAKDENETSISNDANQEDNAKQDWHNVCLRPLAVSNITVGRQIHFIFKLQLLAGNRHCSVRTLILTVRTHFVIMRMKRNSLSKEMKFSYQCNFQSWNLSKQ